MPNIRIYINNTEVSYYKLEDLGLTFTWQAKLINEINSFSFVTANTITLPLTTILNNIFKSPTVIDTTNSVSNREYYDIDITWNDSPVIRGYIKTQRVIILDNDEYIEFTIEPKEKHWISQFEDFKLTELDFTASPDQSHSLTYSNIVTSETLSPSTREYVYAPIDIGEVGRLQVLWVSQVGVDTYFYYIGEAVVAAGGTFTANTYGFTETQLIRYNEVFTETADVFWNPRGIYKAKTSSLIAPFTYYNQWGYMYITKGKDPYYWEIADFYPSIRHSAIVRRCFERIGYNVTIVDSSEYFEDKYNFYHNIEKLNELEAKRTGNDKFKVRVPLKGYKLQTLFYYTTYIMPFMNITDYGLITNSKYTDTNSDVEANVIAYTNISRFTANESIIIKFRWNYHIGLYVPSGVLIRKIILYIKQYDSGGTLRRTLSETTIYNTTGTQLSLEGIIDTSFTYMVSGDYIVPTAYFENFAAGGVDIYLYDSNTLESFPYEGGNFKGKSIRLNEYLPDRTAKEYIKDLSFINNWEFYTNERLRHVYIVREDYKRTGKIIDFTGKLNRSEAVELEEVGLKWGKKLYFNWLKDDKDWSIKFIEQVTKAGLSNIYEEKELEMVSRFGYGLITNLNVFTTEIAEYLNEIYAASLDKFELTNYINFNTVEMKGEETWAHVPTFKRVDYEPRYLTITFGVTLEDSGINGFTDVTYSIEGNPNHITYPYVSFLEPLHYGTSSGLLMTKYAKRTRAIKYGWILRGQFAINENDINTFVEVYNDNNFRSDYILQLKGVQTKGELIKINNFSPLTFNKTEIEFLLYRDDF